MNSLTYDRRAQALIFVISMNVAVVILFSVLPDNVIDKSNGVSCMVLVAAAYMAVSGDMDIIRNIECLLNGYRLAIFRLYIFVFFTVSTIQYQYLFTLAFFYPFLNLIVWWIVLYEVIELPFAGYYYYIRKTLIPIFFGIVGLITFFVYSMRVYVLYLILYEFLELTPSALIIYICFRKLKLENNQKCKCNETT